MICCRRRSHDHIEPAAWPTASATLGHNSCPLVGRCLIERKNPALKEGKRSVRPVEPVFQLAPLSPERLCENATLDFGQCECRDEEIRTRLLLKPVEQSSRRFPPRHFADNVRVEEISRQRSISRPCSIGRSISQSTPTNGDRRSAATMLAPDGVVATVFWVNSFRKRLAAASSAASWRATCRMSSLSRLRPQT